MFTMVVVEAIGVHSARACEVRCSTVVATGQEGPAVKAEAIATYLQYQLRPCYICTYRARCMYHKSIHGVLNLL